MSPMRTLILRRYYEPWVFAHRQRDRNFSFWQHNSRSSPSSLPLFNFQHRISRHFTPENPGIATKNIVDSRLISLEKFRKGINWVQSFNLYWYTIQGCGKIEEEIIVRLDRSAWSSVNATISQRLHSDRVYTGVRVCVCVRRARFDVALKAFLFFLGYV